MQKMNAVSLQVQKGFTLIELVVVIVILGILAATALPKFADMGADARKSSVKAAGGAMASAASLAHAKWLIAGGTTATTTVVLDGTSISVNTAGYPTGVDVLVAAGLPAATDTNYTIVSAAGSATVSPVNATAATCGAVYTASSGTVATTATTC